MWLIVAARIEDQLTEQLSVFDDHPNVKIIDEDQDPRADELPPRRAGVHG
jgi:hypothetical protein